MNARRLMSLPYLGSLLSNCCATRMVIVRTSPIDALEGGMASFETKRRCRRLVNDSVFADRKLTGHDWRGHYSITSSARPSQSGRHGEQLFIPSFLFLPRSHRRRYSIPADPPCATLQRSIRLLDRGDEDFCARLQIALVSQHVNNNGRIGGDKDFLFSVLVFQRQRLPVNRGDNLFNVRVGHCALRPKIPWIVSFSGSAHGLRKDMYF